MPEVQSRFTISDTSEDYLWLRLDRDRESGLEVPVPKESPEYDSRTQERLSDLDTGRTVIAVLVNENENNTAWRVKDLPVD